MAQIWQNFSFTAYDLCMFYLALASLYAGAWLGITFYTFTFNKPSKFKPVILCYTLFQFSMIFVIYGLNCKVLWPSKLDISAIFPAYNVLAHAFGCAFAVLFMGLYCRVFNWNVMIRNVQFIVVAALTVAVGFAFTHPMNAIKGIYIVGLSSIICIAYSIYEISRFDKQAAFAFAMAWFSLIVGSIFYAMENLGFLHTTFLSEYGFLIGSALEMSTLAFVLIRFQKDLYEAKKIVHDAVTPILAIESLYQDLFHGIDALKKDELAQTLIKMKNAITYVRESLHMREEELIFRTILLKTITALVEGHILSAIGNKISFEVSYELGAENAQVHCAPAKVARGISNLISNAIDVVEGQASPWIELTIEIRGSDALFSVANSGTPITPEEWRCYLTPGYSSKEEHQGNGLAIVQDAAKFHKGRVYLDNLPNYTRVTMSLPIAVGTNGRRT